MCGVLYDVMQQMQYSGEECMKPTVLADKAEVRLYVDLAASVDL